MNKNTFLNAVRDIKNFNKNINELYEIGLTGEHTFLDDMLYLLGELLLDLNEDNVHTDQITEKFWAGIAGYEDVNWSDFYDSFIEF